MSKSITKILILCGCILLLSLGLSACTPAFRIFELPEFRNLPRDPQRIVFQVETLEIDVPTDDIPTVMDMLFSRWYRGRNVRKVEPDILNEWLVIYDYAENYWTVPLDVIFYADSFFRPEPDGLSDKLFSLLRTNTFKITDFAMFANLPRNPARVVYQTEDLVEIEIFGDDIAIMMDLLFARTFRKVAEGIVFEISRAGLRIYDDTDNIWFVPTWVISSDGRWYERIPDALDDKLSSLKRSN